MGDQGRSWEEGGGGGRGEGGKRGEWGGRGGGNVNHLHTQVLLVEKAFSRSSLIDGGSAGGGGSGGSGVDKRIPSKVAFGFVKPKRKGEA